MKKLTKIEYPVLNIIDTIRCITNIQSTLETSDKEHSTLYQKFINDKGTLVSYIIANNGIGERFIDGLPELIPACNRMSSLHIKLIGADLAFFEIRLIEDTPTPSYA